MVILICDSIFSWRCIIFLLLELQKRKSTIFFWLIKQTFYWPIFKRKTLLAQPNFYWSNKTFFWVQVNASIDLVILLKNSHQVCLLIFFYIFCLLLINNFYYSFNFFLDPLSFIMHIHSRLTNSRTSHFIILKEMKYSVLSYF